MSAVRRNGKRHVEISAGFWLLMAWLNYTDKQGLMLWTMLAAAVHELGHLCAARLQGGRLVYLRLSAVGAEMQFQTKLSYMGEILCALAGPGVNLTLAVAIARLDREWALPFAGINLALGLFNLLPVCRLDGGRVLGCVLVCLFGVERGEWLKEKSDILWIALCLTAGSGLVLTGGNITLLVVAGWLAIIFQKSSREKGCQRATE